MEEIIRIDGKRKLTSTNLIMLMDVEKKGCLRRRILSGITRQKRNDYG
mgnify:CR=1 FL=1